MFQENFLNFFFFFWGGGFRPPTCKSKTGISTIIQTYISSMFEVKPVSLASLNRNSQFVYSLCMINDGVQNCCILDQAFESCKTSGTRRWIFCSPIWGHLHREEQKSGKCIIISNFTKQKITLIFIGDQIRGIYCLFSPNESWCSKSGNHVL